MIRFIREEDAASCAALYSWYILHSDATFDLEETDEAEFVQKIRNITASYPWIVYEEEGKILGYAYLSSFNPKPAYRFTCDLAIYVSHDVRHQGIGTLLMNAIISLAYRAGYSRMYSLITDGNEASIRLHEKNGFLKQACFPRVGYKNGKWLGVCYYCLVLRNSPVPEEPSLPAAPEA